MGRWLKCTISPGQFTGEFAVHGKMFDSTEFSLFASRDDLEFAEEPTPDKPISGFIRVKPAAQEDDLLLVNLPRPTFENGRTITVKGSETR